MEEILMQIQLLIENFGAWAFALVGATYVLMIPLNFLYKKIMKAEKFERLRKFISGVSVYVVAMLVVELFSLIFASDKISFMYVFASSIPVGFLAQVLWALTKFVKDYGWKPLIAKITQSKELETALRNLGIDKRVISVIAEQVKDIEVNTLDEYMQNELKYSAELRTKLTGFVGNDKIQNAITTCLNAIKKSLPKQENKVAVAKEVQ